MKVKHQGEEHDFKKWKENKEAIENKTETRKKERKREMTEKWEKYGERERWRNEKQKEVDDLFSDWYLV